MSIPKKIKPEATYRVTMARALKYGGALLSPAMHEIELKGKVLQEIKEHVSSAEEIPAQEG